MRIALVGDVMLGRLVNKRLKRENPAYPWGDLLPLLDERGMRHAGADVVVGHSAHIFRVSRSATAGP